MSRDVNAPTTTAITKEMLRYNILQQVTGNIIYP